MVEQILTSNKFYLFSLNVSAPLEEQKVLRLQQADHGHLQRRAGDPQEDGAGQEAAAAAARGLITLGTECKT